jgi:undecaprenyl-diphosphatase
MTILEAILLGIIQGLTEFLPISSSAHLVIVPYLFNWQIDPQINFAFDVLVQLGTLLAVIVYFWSDLLQIITGFVRALLARRPFGTPEARLGWYIILATIPAGLAGLLVKDLVEAAFNSPQVTAGFLFVTAALLVVSERIGKRSRGLAEISTRDALVMGLMQALSIFPGISRSGSTIAGGLLSGLDRRAAARFSFLMAIPIMLAAGLLAALDLAEVPNFTSMLPVIAVGFIAAAVVGYLSIRWLLAFLQKHSLTVFAVYCACAGGLVLIVSLLR